MPCEQIRASIHDYIDGDLNKSQMATLDAHCRHCCQCTDLRDSLLRQQVLLKSLPVLPATANFERDVLQNATQTDPGQAASHGNATMPSYYKVAAAVMLFALVLWSGLSSFNPATETAPAMFAVDDQVHTIKVAIDSEKALSSVNLRVEISDNLELAGFGNKKTINWNTGLREGVNIIALPIIGIAEGRGDIVTRVRLNGKEKVMHISTEYRSPGNVRYEQNLTSPAQLAG